MTTITRSNVVALIDALPADYTDHHGDRPRMTSLGQFTAWLDATRRRCTTAAANHLAMYEITRDGEFIATARQYADVVAGIEALRVSR